MGPPTPPLCERPERWPRTVHGLFSEITVSAASSGCQSSLPRGKKRVSYGGESSRAA